jgi:hypothetical protein
MRFRRILVPAAMTGRELLRRHVAMALLTGLPLAFYGSSVSQGPRHAAVTGGIAMAFSVAGASIFAALTARPVDQRLVLAGYHPYELLLGRLLFLELFGVVVSALFSVIMVLGTGPAHPVQTGVGVELVAMTSVPFGLAVGALAPHELEGVLILIGIVGIQLTLDSSETIAKLLPFWGPERLIGHSVGVNDSTAIAPLVALAYAIALLVVATYIVHRRAPASRGSGIRQSEVDRISRASDSRSRSPVA